MNDLLDASMEGNLTVKLRYRAIIIWSFLLLVGIIFKLMHWPFSAFLILIPSAGITAYSSCKVIMITKKTSAGFILFSLLGFLWMGIILLGIFFNNGHPYNMKGLTAHIISIIILSVIYALSNYNQLRTAKKKNDTF